MKTLASLLFVLAFSTPAFAQLTCAAWPQWNTFKTHFISPKGRVIDLGSEYDITTSEGQSYSLFFALVANDQASFDTLLEWTEVNLSEGDLSTRLPAWKWGIKEGEGKILDSNPASDSDLWIAYTLSQAAKLWQDRRYAVLSSVLAERIIREETAQLPKLGITLLPGPNGFKDENTWKLNPSYAPLFILKQFAELYPHSPWQQLHDNSANMLISTAAKGFSPDWVNYNAEQGFFHDKHAPALGSYNAIRVYLWASLMAEDAPYKSALMKQLTPMVEHIVSSGKVPLETQTVTGKVSGTGPIGFGAALLPFLAAENASQSITALQQQMMMDTGFISSRYYDSVLYLFGTSALNKRFSINKNGELITNWSAECQ
ncbi:cellulose synthase complex periplasmic endoglucanase BcsZ [Pseudoalteromonas lipolytica]|uniref:cellulase n=1 Tax=Pseudoalteromonas lipolytica TaxID=570156 RepID=A0ABY1GNU9_9GAMM|nr:cellulose synthase complex periplasmic endoglucanase BcsZ [Pseudoalteromonas lipolytica]MBE0350145.1 endoglucanase [Pseudoalteromonas lipolytica LMEB 39]SFT91416.1 endoglucanase [Pseudoalteromonas lipolytica]